MELAYLLMIVHHRPAKVTPMQSPVVEQIAENIVLISKEATQTRPVPWSVDSTAVTARMATILIQIQENVSQLSSALSCVVWTKSFQIAQIPFVVFKNVQN